MALLEEERDHQTHMQTPCLSSLYQRGHHQRQPWPEPRIKNPSEPLCFVAYSVESIVISAAEHGTRQDDFKQVMLRHTQVPAFDCFCFLCCCDKTLIKPTWGGKVCFISELSTPPQRKDKAGTEAMEEHCLPAFLPWLAYFGFQCNLGPRVLGRTKPSHITH